MAEGEVQISPLFRMPKDAGKVFDVIDVLKRQKDDRNFIQRTFSVVPCIFTAEIQRLNHEEQSLLGTQPTTHLDIADIEKMRNTVVSSRPSIAADSDDEESSATEDGMDYEGAVEEGADDLKTL